VSVLKQLHDDLDAAVFDAYGWPRDLSDEQILQRLVDLNQHVLFINFDGLDLGVTTAQNAATQPKKYRCDVAIARARLTFGHLTQNEIIAAAQPSSV